MDTIGTIREISRYADYSRFGRRHSPTSIMGSRFSSVSSVSTSGCWCPYALIVLLIIFVIASLVASNFSIYFLMKDNCDSNMAKMERDWLSKPKRRPEEVKAPTQPESEHTDSTMESKRHLAPPTMSTSKPVLPERLETSESSAQSVVNKVFARAPVESKQKAIASAVIAPSSSHKLDKNVAGIVQLVATIRIPQQAETSNFMDSTVVNSSIEDYFDLSKYFSLKQSTSTPSQGQFRRKRDKLSMKKTFTKL